MESIARNQSQSQGFPSGSDEFRTMFFSELLKRPVCAGKIKDRIGKVTDLVFALAEPYPEAVGIFIDQGWGKPTQFVPWDRVRRIDDDAIFVKPAEGAAAYPPFVDQLGWILLDAHLMGRTILDMDGRRIEVVNDIQLLESRGRLLLVQVETSVKGFLRRLGFRHFPWIKDRFISWKFVQPLSVEDALATDKVSLSVTHKQIRELPAEDLADALEELSGPEQEALFSALDSEKAADTLIEAEPRARRQIIASLRQERARTIFSEMTVPQIADLFSVLPHDDLTEMMALLPKEQAERIHAILSERESTASALLIPDFLTMLPGTRAGEALASIRTSGREPGAISYIYITAGEDNSLMGVVDVRELLLASDETSLSDLMTAPVVTAEEEDMREDLEEIFAKYHYRMVPVVDHRDRLLGVVRYNDIMKGLVTRVKV